MPSRDPQSDLNSASKRKMLSGASAVRGVSLYLLVLKLKLPVLERNSTSSLACSLPFSWTCPQVFPPVLQVQGAAYLGQAGWESSEI